MTFNPQDMYAIASNILETAIGLVVEPDGAVTSNTKSRSTAACIHITGAWNGAILLDCPEEIARIAASVMFSSDLQSVTVVDQQDAIAELVNMLGGNFKALLPETCFLSLPAAVEGGDYTTRIPGSTLLGRVPLSCQGHAISITVLEKVQPELCAA